MEEFSEQVCKLSSLIKLRIYDSKSLKLLPHSFGRLTGLTHLEINSSPEWEELPSSFGELTALKHLHLEGCEKHLPGGLESLKYLYVRNCEHLSVELYRRPI